MGSKFRPETRFFVIFFKFCSLVFLDIAYNDSSQIGPKFGPEVSKLAQKLGFLPYSQVWFVSFPWNCMQW